MDTRVLVAIILVAGVAGGFASNYVGDYYFVTLRARVFTIFIGLEGFIPLLNS